MPVVSQVGDEEQGRHQQDVRPGEFFDDLIRHDVAMHDPVNAGAHRRPHLAGASGMDCHRPAQLMSEIRYLGNLTIGE